MKKILVDEVCRSGRGRGDRPALISLGFIVVGMILLSTSSVEGQERGVSYTLQPSYNIIRWDDKAGLQNTELIGGRLAYNLGRHISLQGYYLGRSDAQTNLSGLPLHDPWGDPLVDRKLDIANYGADLVLNLGSGPVTPFVKGGGGVLVLDPVDGQRTEQIAVKVGAGFRFGISRLNAEVSAEDLAFRLDRYDLVSAGECAICFPEDGEKDELRHNLSLSLGLNLRLGESEGGARQGETDHAIEERFAHGLRGLSIPVEPFVGRLDFSDALALETQELVGVRAGLDFGRFFGLRGYYWRGTSDQFDDTEPIDSYGGEARFGLSEGTGAVPYVVAGVGQLDFMTDYPYQYGAPMTDKTMLILGGGLGFTMGDHFRFDLSARDHILSGKRVGDVVGTEDLFSNWMFAGGVSFSIGGRTADGRKPIFSTGEEQEETPPPLAGAAEAEALAAEELSVETGAPVAEAPSVEPLPSVPVPGVPPEEEVEIIRPGEIPPVRTYDGDRIIAIPVPSEGEIYIRYGRPGGVQIESKSELPGDEGPAAPQETAVSVAETVGEAMPPGPVQQLDTEAIRRAIREELERSLSQQPPAAQPVTDEQLALLERRLAQRIDDRIDRSVKQEVPPVATVPAQEMPHKWSFRDARTYAAANVDAPEQGVLGLRMNLGRVTRGSRIDFVPELALGVGSGGTSTLGAINFQYDFKQVVKTGSWSPYISAGAGLLLYGKDVKNRPGQEGVLNVAYGVTAHIKNNVVFLEHQGIDLYDLNRILLGLRLGI